MKFYEGFLPKVETSDRVLVYVTEDGTPVRLEHHVRHSPDGFSWGYAGSGPAELAMCILWDFLGHEPHPMLYQKFKEDYVAQWDQRDWVLSSEAIKIWLELNRNIPRRVHKAGTAAAS